MGIRCRCECQFFHCFGIGRATFGAGAACLGAGAVGFAIAGLDVISLAIIGFVVTGVA